MASGALKIGADECVGGENVTAYSEDEEKNKNVDRPEVTDNEPWVNKDNAPQLGLDVSPPSQKDCPSAGESRKAKASFQHYGGCNSDPAQSEECKTAFSRPKRTRKTLLTSMDPPNRDTVSHNNKMVPQTANSAHPPPSVNEDLYELWNNNPARDEDHTDEFSDTASLLLSSPNRDTTTRNYGRAPLIWDLFDDSDWPLRLVDNAYGGGFNTRDDQREIIVQSGNASQDNGASAAEVSATVVHPPQPKSSPTQDLLTVHPPQPESIRQVNPNVEIIDKNGGCFPWFRK